MSTATSSARDWAQARVVRGALSNGMTWSCWPEPRDRVVTCQVWLRVGSADEPPGLTGAAHMLEHLMFRGTTAVPDGEFDARMERLGALVNAATWMDSTFYTTTAAPDVLGEVLTLEADRMANLALTDDVFTAERGVVESERRQVVDGVPEALFREHFAAVAHEGTPYAWPVIGWAEDIARYERSGIESFYRAHYTPAAAHVVVCGGVDAATVAREIERAFGAWTGPAATERAPHTLPGRARRLERTLPLSSARVTVGFDAPGRGDRQFAAWRVAQAVLAGGEAARLPVELEFEAQLALDVDLDLVETRHAAAMTFEATVRQDATPEELLDALDAELEALADEGPDDEELTRAIRCQLTDDARALASTQSRAEWMGESWIVFDDPTTLFDAGAQLAAVTADDVRAVAEAMLAPERRTIGVARCE